MAGLSERKSAALMVERGVIEEDVRDGLHVRVPVFLFDVAPRPDIAKLLRRGGSLGFAETPWTVEKHHGERCAVLAVTPTETNWRPFSVAFPLTSYGSLLEAALKMDELGLRPNTIAALPPPLDHLTIWVRNRRGANWELRAILEGEY